MDESKELYQSFLNGNNEAFDKIMDIYAENLTYFLQRYVGQAHIAQDLAQDVFVYVLMHPKKYNFKYALKTYLYTIGKSKALNYLKKENKIISLNDNIIYDVDDDLENSVFRNERAENLKADINKLSKDYQIALYLADIEELPYADICTILKKPLPQVKMLIYRARKKLKLILEKEPKKYDE